MKIKGITLIELIIVLVIMSILAAISLMLYTKNAQRGKRTDAIQTLLAMSLAEERYRTNNSQYGTLAQVWGGVTTTAGGYYTLGISNVTATSYTLTATAVGQQANDKADSTTCTPLIFSVSNGTLTKTPTACWPN